MDYPKEKVWPFEVYVFQRERMFYFEIKIKERFFP